MNDPKINIFNKSKHSPFVRMSGGHYAELSTDVVPLSPQHSVSLDWEAMLSHKRVNTEVSGTFP